MNKALILAAPLVMLAACAAPASNTDKTHVASAPSSGVQYCKKDRLFANASEITCTWSSSISEACENTNLTSVSVGSVASGPASAGRCGNGQWLVSVTTK
jgi:hypothetical protein